MARTDPGACPAPVSPAWLQPYPYRLLPSGLVLPRAGWPEARWPWPDSSIPTFFQVSMKAPEATVTLPLFVGNIAVNQTPLSPCPGRESSPGTLSLVVPSAPPQEEAEAVASGPHFSDPVSLSTKSHSQQQPLSAPLGSVSVLAGGCSRKAGVLAGEGSCFACSPMVSGVITDWGRPTTAGTWTESNF